MKRPSMVLSCLVLACALVPGCGGGGSPKPVTGCNGPCAPRAAHLTAPDVERIVSQAVQEGAARRQPATIAVVDRVGNVLAVFAMSGAAPSITLNGGTGANVPPAVTGGLDGVTLGAGGVGVPGPAYAAISMALTAAYFSSEGNAFSTRTAGQIIQEHFNPDVVGTPSGPLFGVQFSQITCSDVSRQADVHGSVGPKRAPLGFAANPGGLPLYKNGTVVGAIGVMAGTNYTIDRVVRDTSPTVGEHIAVAGTYGYAAPTDIRANRITADNNFLRFTDSDETASVPANAPAFAETLTRGSLVRVAGYYDGGQVVAGTEYGSAASGIRADTSTALAGSGAYVLVDATNAVRFPPKAGSDGGLNEAEVTQILKSALEVANRTRAQIRRPLGLSAQVSAVVVDTNGEILGHVRSPDALVDSADVVVQKARTAAFFSNPVAADELNQLPDAQYVGVNSGQSPIAPYVGAARTLLVPKDSSQTFFSNGTAFSTRSIGNISAPTFPDGLDGKPAGPLSKPLPSWSIFNNGLALDLVYNQLVAALSGAPRDDRSKAGCTGNQRIRNGITLFGGGFPIYRGNRLVGGIGVSGDGTEQSDLIGFLSLDKAGKALGTGIGNAPKALRADTLEPQGTGSRLRYVNCPVAPFLDSTTSDVCGGL